MTPEEKTRSLWRKADAVCFDVDSTDEAIDELAQFLGKGDEVKAFTKTAMNGSVLFGESLRTRMSILKLTRPQLDSFLINHPVSLTPGVKELISSLQARGVQVFLVSGGFRDVIEPVAKELQVPKDNIYANRLIFDDKSGNYVDFDRNEPTSDSGSKNKGKPRVCGLLKERFGFKTLIMIGDGSTDLEACPPADGFIGFGGNQVRESVKQQASWFIYSFAELLEELDREKRGC